MPRHEERRSFPSCLAARLQCCGAGKRAAAAPFPNRFAPVIAGLPDDRTPVSEAPFAATSAQGAGQVVQTYFALLEAGKYEQARALWSAPDQASGTTAAGFVRYAEYHAQIGAPGRIEGAAGALYVDVPVVAYGRLKSGAPFTEKGTITLRRCNDVPGCTLAERAWHISASSLKPPRRQD